MDFFYSVELIKISSEWAMGCFRPESHYARMGIQNMIPHIMLAFTATAASVVDINMLWTLWRITSKGWNTLTFKIWTGFKALCVKYSPTLLMVVEEKLDIIH